MALSPIFASGVNFFPRNTACMTAGEIFTFLGPGKNFSFMDGPYRHPKSIMMSIVTKDVTKIDGCVPLWDGCGVGGHISDAQDGMQKNT